MDVNIIKIDGADRNSLIIKTTNLELRLVDHSNGWFDIYRNGLYYTYFNGSCLLSPPFGSDEFLIELKGKKIPIYSKRIKFGNWEIRRNKNSIVLINDELSTMYKVRPTMIEVYKASSKEDVIYVSEL